jgi:hypothetical protein
MLKPKFLFKKIIQTETVAYWAHGFFVAFFIMVLIDENYMLYYVFYFPAAIVLTFLTVIWGLFSVPTAVLSLLLVGVVLENFSGPMLHAYVLAWFIIVGYHVFRVLAKLLKHGD